MKTFNIQLPDAVDLDTKDISFFLASHLYGAGKLSLGQAASMIGFSKRAFIELLGKYGVSLFNEDRGALIKDLKNA